MSPTSRRTRLRARARARPGRARRRAGAAEATCRSSTRRSLAAGGRPAGTSAKLDLELDPDAARDRGRRDRVRPPARGDRREPARDARRRRLRVPARPARRGPPHALAAAPVQDASTRERLQHFRDEFKRLQQVTGDLRDLDVYLLDFDDLRDVAAGGHAGRPRPAAQRARAPPREGADRHAPGAAGAADAGRAARVARSSSRRRRPSERTVARARLAPDHARLPQDGQDGPARSTTTAPPRTCTSCARSARSCATCSSSSRASIRPTSSSRSSRRSRACRTSSAASRTARSRRNALRALAPEVGRPGDGDGDGRARRALHEGGGRRARRVRRPVRAPSRASRSGARSRTHFG